MDLEESPRSRDTIDDIIAMTALSSNSSPFPSPLRSLVPVPMAAGSSRLDATPHPSSIAGPALTSTSMAASSLVPGPDSSRTATKDLPISCPDSDCEDPFPTEPSSKLLELLRNQPTMSKKKTPGELLTIAYGYKARICAQIKSEINPCDVDMSRYPLKLDFDDITRRLRQMIPKILSIIKSGCDGFIFKILQARADAARKAAKTDERPAFSFQDLNIASRGCEWNDNVRDLVQPG